MKKSRFLTIICILVLVLSSISFASASTSLNSVYMTSNNKAWLNYEDRFYLLKNGETAEFFLQSIPAYFCSKQEDGPNNIEEIIFDVEGKVKAKCSASWVHIKSYKGGLMMTFDTNGKYKDRTAKITVTGKNYKAKLVVTQWGTTSFSKVTRNKKTIAFKVKPGQSLDYMYLLVEGYKVGAEHTTIVREYIPIPEGKKTVKYKLKAGWIYLFSIDGYYLKNKELSWVQCTTDFLSFDATDPDSLTGTETLR